jgi:hypothetical protein
MTAGLKAEYRLDKKLRGTMTKSEFAAAPFVEGEKSTKYETSIALDQGDPTGLYVFNLVLSPTNELYTGQSVISSVTTIGVLRVSCALTNVVTVAPWFSMSTDTTNEIQVAVSDVVNPFSIGAGDSIWSYEDDTFTQWEHVGNGEWNSPVTATTRGVFVSAESFPPGKAFWFIRNAPSDYICLIGRYTGEDYVFNLAGGTTAKPGYTLVANPTFFDVDLNDLEFVDGEGNVATPGLEDRITTQGISGRETIYFRNSDNTEWGRNVRKKVNGVLRTVWTKGGVIPSGTGFWYESKSGTTLKIRFEAAK